MFARTGTAEAATVRLRGHEGVDLWLKLGAAPLYLLIGIAVRLVMFGNPIVQKDEQLYLLVGQRMAHGALPFVDIWDRKPWGLFAIYRSVFVLPMDPVLAYQMLGLVFSVLTALVIERIARLIAPPRAAALAGAAYLLWQPIFSVALGQSPVFYNLLVALAAWIVIEARARSQDHALTRRGMAAMLLLGLAMQIKYTVVFEGMALGLMLLARGHADGWSWRRLTLTGGVWIGGALVPTIAVAVAYLAAGHGETFFYANFISIFGRSTDHTDALKDLGVESLEMIPFILAILVAPRRLSPVRGERPASLRDLQLWALAAVAGFLLFGTWFDHYLGPVLVPLSALAAPCLARKRAGERWYGRLLLGAGLIGAVVVPIKQIHKRGTTAQFEAASHAISRELGGRCLYVFEGDSAFYRSTNACIPTRFTFPSHLSIAREADALGIDAAVEVQRILSGKPGVIMMAGARPSRNVNNRTRALVLKQLRGSYEHYAKVQLGTRSYSLWRLRKVS